MRLGEAVRPGFPVAQFPCLRVRIFVAVLNANREVSRGLRSPVLESTLGSRTGLFSLNIKMEVLHPLQIPLASYLSLK